MDVSPQSSESPARASKSTQTGPPPAAAQPKPSAVDAAAAGRECSPQSQTMPRSAPARTSRSTQTAPPLAAGLCRPGPIGGATGGPLLLPRIVPHSASSMRTSTSAQTAPPLSAADLCRPVSSTKPAAAVGQDMVAPTSQHVNVATSTPKETAVNQHPDVDHLSGRKREHEGINTEEVEEGDPDMPRVGMEFDSFNDAEDFYHRYSAKVGFSVRIRRTKFDHGVVMRRTYCCYKEGFRDTERRKAVAYHRPDIRCGCNAHYSVKLLPDGKYQVFQFDPNHNHDVVAPEKVHLLRSHRRLLAVQKSEVDRASAPGMTSTSTMESFSRQLSGCKNLKHLQTKRKIAPKTGEASAILEYFQRMQSSNPSSSYALQLDENELLTNIFWTDPIMIVDYHHFGDVVCFDTSYKTNNEECPLVLFVGVNHHRQLIIFGAALLFDDTAATFEWLFSTFIQTMGGKMPKTILTEQSAEISNAISLVLPRTCHRLCAWYVYKSATAHLHDVFKKVPKLLGDFEKCVFDCTDCEQFELAWCDMITIFNLQENKWLKDMFEAREDWSLAYEREHFCADMSATQRNETFHAALRKCLPRGCTTLQFFEHFEKLLDSRRYEELKADCNMSLTTQYMCVQWKLLKHAESVYTPAVFKMFEREVVVIFDLELSIICVDGTITKYRVSETNPSQVCIVLYDDVDSSISCTCRSFEYVGLLCRHALKVFERINIMTIPDQYILKRWTKKAKEGAVSDYHGLLANLDSKDQILFRYRDLCPILIQLAKKASLCDEASNMVANFALKMIKDVDSHVECALASRSLAETSTVRNHIKLVEAESQNIEDGLTMHDDSSTGAEEIDDGQTVHLGYTNESRVSGKEKIGGSNCSVKNSLEKAVKGKRGSPKSSKPKKSRNAPHIGEQTGLVPSPDGTERSPHLQPQVVIPSSSVSWPFIANYSMF